MPEDTRLSKFLSLVLRHRTQEFGIELDSEGYTDLGDLFGVVQVRYRGSYTYDDLIRTLIYPAADGKQRFELKGSKVRALYGHNAKVTQVRYDTAIPPETLYHGTTRKALPAIRHEGLKPQQRQYVHLSVAPQRALESARRQGKPVLLKILATKAHEAGIVFYQPDETHFLVSSLPAEYIDFPAEPPEKP